LAPLAPLAPWHIGDVVDLRGEAWLVARAERFETCTLLTLEGRGRHNGGRHWRAVAPFDRPIVRHPLPPQRRKRLAVRHAALRAIAAVKPACGLWTAAGARMDLLAYQLEPALAVLNGATRILLADDVGLGKTVQAGLILRELRARGLADRALILTPAGLRDLWEAELRDRFDLRPAVLDQAAIATTLPALTTGVNPWSAHEIVIASIDLVKRPEVLAAVQQAHFDLLIADEAHHLSPGTGRAAAIEQLASQCVWIVLASATPHSGDDAAFEHLKELGAMGEPMVVFRRTRKDVGDGKGRRVHVLTVAPSAPEQRMLRHAEEYATAIWKGAGPHDRGARLLSIVLARRAASSAAALHHTLTRRLHLLTAKLPAEASTPPLPWDDIDDGDGAAADEVLSIPGLRNGSDERHVIENLIAAAVAARPHSSKINRIARLLRRVREPAIVFTEYRDTLEAIVEALDGDRAVTTLHGGLTPAERRRNVDAFNGGEVDLLVATDAAGEELNLHRRCRLVVDVELPWNPSRLDQRFGRVDRIGQTRRAHAIRLVHRGTIESRVLACLEERRQRASRTMQAESAWSNEGEIAATVLGRQASSVGAAPRIAPVVAGGGALECQRLSWRRTVFASTGGGAARRAVWNAPRHPTRYRTELIVLLGLERRRLNGQVADEACCGLRVTLLHRPDGRTAWRRLVNGLDAHPMIVAAMRSALLIQETRVTRELAALSTSVGLRVRHIRSRLRAAPAAGVQPALFDRRSQHEADRQTRAIELREVALDRRAESAAVSAPCTSRARLIAVWPVGD